jgi:co-chaperonin GroES (HSP10)
MEFKPVNVWILVEKMEPEERKTKSGIYMPNHTEEEQKTVACKVLAISDDVHVACKREAKDLPYSVGDVIVTHSQVGIKYDIFNKDDKRYWMKYDSAMAVGVPVSNAE